MYPQMWPDSERNGTLSPTLCFFNEPENGEEPTYIAESLQSQGKRNYQPDRRRMVIRDIRGQEDGFSLHLNSFAALPDEYPLDTGIIPVDWNNNTEVLTRYVPYVKSLFMSKIAGAADVVVFDHTMRKASVSKTAAPRQVRKVHIDQSPRCALGRARRHLDGGQFDAISAGEKGISSSSTCENRSRATSQTTRSSSPTAGGTGSRTWSPCARSILSTRARRTPSGPGAISVSGTGAT